MSFSARGLGECSRINLRTGAEKMGHKKSDGSLFDDGRMARRRSPTRLPSPLFISAEQREVIFSRKGEPAA